MALSSLWSIHWQYQCEQFSYHQQFSYHHHHCHVFYHSFYILTNKVLLPVDYFYFIGILQGWISLILFEYKSNGQLWRISSLKNPVADLLRFFYFLHHKAANTNFSIKIRFSKRIILRSCNRGLPFVATSSIFPLWKDLSKPALFKFCFFVFWIVFIMATETTIIKILPTNNCLRNFTYSL